MVLLCFMRRAPWLPCTCLLPEVSHGVVVLHAQGSQGALLGNVQLLQLLLQSGQLLLPLLVESHLGGSVGACLVKTGANVLNVLLQHGAALLSLGPVAPLHSKLLIKLLNAGLELLDLLGILGAKGGFVINLGGKGTAFLLLASNTSTKVRLDTLKIRERLLSQLQISLNLLLGLVNITLHLLFTLQSILGLIEGLFKLALDLGEMLTFVLGSLDIFFCLLLSISSSSLLLSKLCDHVSLVSNLVLQSSDLVVFVCSVLLSGCKGILGSLDIILKSGNSGIGLGHLCIECLHLALLALDAVVDTIQLLLDIGGHTFDSDSLVNDLLHS